LKTIPVDFTIYDYSLDGSSHINAVYHCPYSRIFSSNLDAVYEAYRETRVGLFIYNDTHRVIAYEYANGIAFDSNNFETALNRMISEKIIEDGDNVCLHISHLTWKSVYKIVTGSYLDTTAPDLWSKLSDPDFEGAFENLLGVYADIANSANIEFIFEVYDEPGYDPYKRIVSDRLYRIIHNCNDPAGLQTVAAYYTNCDDEADPGDYNIPEPYGPNIPPLTDLVDYKIWSARHIDEGYANHQNPNYHGNFGYCTTYHSHMPDPIYNRFLHGLFAFGSGSKIVGAYAMGDYINDPYNDFDASYGYIFPFTYPDFLYAYPTWSGKLLHTIGGLEGIREGIKDAKYIATLQNILNDPNTDWDDPNVIDANDYLDSVYDCIDPNYCPAYSDYATKFGYYKVILEDISGTSDPNDFEAFTSIRKTIAEHIIAVQDPNS
jgi:hypothetical protein